MWFAKPRTRGGWEPAGRRRADRWDRCWLLRGAVVAVTTAALLLIARAAWADPPDCTNLWEGATPHCLMRRAGGAIASGIAGKIAEGVSWLAKQIGDGARTAGRPDVTQPWFSAAMFNTRQLGVLFAVVGMLLSLIYAALKRDVGEIGRTLTRVLAAGLTTGGITLVVAAANNLVDNLCDYVLGPHGWAAVTDSLKRPVQLLGQAAGNNDPSSSSMTTPSVIAILVGVLMLIALAVIWCELMVRRVVIDLCVLFWPLAVSGAVWANARLWTRRLAETIAGFVLSKLLIIVILRFAADAFHNMNSISDLIMAIGVYAIAAVAPFWVMRVIGFFGGAIQPGHTGEGVRGAAVGATVAAAMTATRVATSAAGSVGSGSSVGSGGTAGTLGATIGMRAGGRTPMPTTSGATRAGQPGRPAGTDQTKRGFTPGGRTAGADGGTPERGQAGSTAQAASGTAEQESQEPHVRRVPEPPPMPRPKPGKPVPPNLRPATSASSSPPEGSSSSSSSSSPGSTSGSTGGSPGKPPPARGPQPHPAARRPESWPHPRRGDPSAPMRWPQRPPQPPPPPPRREDG